jgi:hypothetical protein
MTKPIAAGLVVLLLLVASGHPSINTPVDLDRSDAAAGQIIGENHAKPLPRLEAATAVLWRLVQVMAWALTILLTATSVLLPRRHDAPGDPSIVAWRALSLRGPPASV